MAILLLCWRDCGRTRGVARLGSRTMDQTETDKLAGDLGSALSWGERVEENSHRMV